MSIYTKYNIVGAVSQLAYCFCNLRPCHLRSISGIVPRYLLFYYMVYMPRNKFDLVAERRALTRTLFYLGKETGDIVNELDSSKIFPEMKTWSSKMAIVKRDLEAIKLEDLQRFRSVQDDAETALREYLQRQMLIFQQAVERRELAVAASASKDIARAHGIETDKPVRQEEDLLTAMRNAMQTARKKEIPSSEKDDTVLLPPILEEVREAEVLSNGA